MTNNMKFTILVIVLLLGICLLNIHYPFITTHPAEYVSKLETRVAADLASSTARANIRKIEELAEIEVNKELGGIDETSADNNATGVQERRRFMLTKEGFIGSDVYELRLFWSPDCGHSKRFMPVWLNIIRALPAGVTYKEYNCKEQEGLTSLSVCAKREFGITSLPTVQLYRVVDGIKYLESISGFRDYRSVKDWLARQSVNLKYNPNAEHFRGSSGIKGYQGEQFADSNTGVGSDPMEVMNKVYGTAGDLYEEAEASYLAESSTDKWGHYRDVEDGCYKASFTRCNENSERPGYQVFTPRGQWGCVFPEPGTALATDFDAAFAVVDQYLSTCTPPKQRKDGTLARTQYTDTERRDNMTKCAVKYKDEIRKFGLCDERKLNEKFNYINNIKAGRAKLPIQDMKPTDYTGTAETASAIFNACRL